jgi:hypothetical protein
MASVGSILGGAFRLLRERPAAVAVWGVTYAVGSIAISLIMTVAMVGTIMPSAVDSARAMEVWAGPVFSLVMLLNLCLLLLAVVLMNAVFRAMLRPEEGGFFFIRLGMDEFRMLGLVILTYIAIFAITVVGWLLVLLITFIAGFVLGKSAITALIAFVLFAAFLCALVWLHVRLSLIFPLTFHRRRISIDGAWDLTRGRFWLLFACYLLIAVIFIVSSFVMLSFTLGDYFAALAQAHGDPDQIRLAGEAFAAKQFGMSLGTKILFGIVGAIFFAAWLALGPGMLASATRELLGDPSEASVFAAESDGSVVD